MKKPSPTAIASRLFFEAILERIRQQHANTGKAPKKVAAYHRKYSLKTR